jgi:protoporphyrinogen oxidase
MTAARISENRTRSNHFEKEKEPGGLARGFREPQWQDSVECFYHHIFTVISDILSLFKDLGVSIR